MKRLARNAVYYNYVVHLGENAYIRQVRHTGLHESWGSWEVGLFKEIGQYQILADERQPAVAVAKALYATGATPPNS